MIIIGLKVLLESRTQAQNSKTKTQTKLENIIKHEPAISTEIECLPANVDSRTDSTVLPKQMIQAQISKSMTPSDL